MVVLRHLLEYTPGEIADLLDLPRGTVNSRLRRGLDALAEDSREARARARRDPRRARGARADVGRGLCGVRRAGAARPSPRRRLVPASRSPPSARSWRRRCSSPGRALFHAIRTTVGVAEGGAGAVLAAGRRGRLLVTSGGGVWVVQDDGSKRRLGAYASASWSPHGRYVVATRAKRPLRADTAGGGTLVARRGPTCASRAGREQRRTRGSRT